jgi:hypothetical protein
MNRRTTFLLTLLTAAPPLVAQEQSPSRSLQIIQAFERIAAQELWPGFKPATIPAEFFDGVNTYLLSHPSPPKGFRGVAGQQGTYVFAGQHPTVLANTGTVVNGVRTATANLSSPRSSPDVLAALLLHETFHVFEAKQYPKWSANEASLFTYPAGNSELLALRRLESAALVRALASGDEKASNCWASTAMGIRAKRFSGLPKDGVAYERGIEAFEGLAAYVQLKAIGAPATLTPEDFPPGHAHVRQRAYATGQALALLLDRMDSTWKSRMGDEPFVSLDELLTARLGEVSASSGCDFSPEETQAAQSRSQRDAAALAADLARDKEGFLKAAGIRLEVVAGKEPLWPQAFDPWNVTVLDSKEVLHTRLLKLGNASGEIEILGRFALTEAAGAHPLFNGVQRVTVTGLADPKVTNAGGKLKLSGQGITATLSGTVVRKSDVIQIQLH